MLDLELRLLAYSVALLFVLVLIQGYAAIHAHGAKAMGGPRDDLPAPTRFQARSEPLVDNYREPSPLRPLAWLVGLIGCILIFFAILGVLQ